jgi:glucokinase
MILAGDLGGTKTNLALFEYSGNELVIEAQERYPSQEHDSLDEIVELFLKKKKVDLKFAAFGVAGPVGEGRAKATNLQWEIQETSLCKITHCPVKLINDLEANAWGISVLKKKELISLHQSPKSILGNRALISAGTGLGEAGLYFDGKKHLPFACEGGHVDFAPTNELEVRLYEFLFQEFGHVSYERVLSGQGLHNIYNFLLKDKGARPLDRLTHELHEKDPAYVISEHALNGTDVLCQEALDLMVSLYGSAAGNLALKFMAYGGVYLGGGIAPKILEKLKSPTFLKAFQNKGRMKDLMKQFPIYVILNDKTALLGAAQCAFYNKNKIN